MSARARTILAVILVVVVAALGYFFLIRPRAEELDQVNQDIEAAEAQEASLRAELARREELRDRAPELEADLARLGQLIPENDEVPNFIFLVQEAANASGVGFVQITPEVPKPPVEGSSVAEIRTTIGARGGYFAVQDFIRRLYRLDRALRIDILSIVAEEDETTARERGRTVMTTTARVFFEPPAGLNPAGTTATTTPPATTTPTTTTSPTPAASP